MFYVYIMASRRNGTLYTGVTNDLVRRVYQHRNNLIPGFTSRYGVHQLVYYEATQDPIAAITREKQIKEWKRLWKIRLIEEFNPGGEDLYDALIDPPAGFLEFTNEVQHLKMVLPWEPDIIRSGPKSGVRLPAFKPKGARSGKSRQLWIARHRALLAR